MRDLIVIVLICSGTTAGWAEVRSGAVDPPAEDAPVTGVLDTDYQTVVWGTAARGGDAAQRRLDCRSPGFATAVVLHEEAGARPSDALPELVARTPGVTVRSIGGLGQFSSVSIRGSSGQQVAVFLEGIPLGDSMGGLVNLADLPLDTLDAVEIYRGYVPVVFGGATLGGAINLVGRIYDGPLAIEVGGGGGSFGGRQGQATLSVPLARGQSMVAHVGYAGAGGAFPFYDQGQTPLFLDDDTTSRRRNNDYNRVLGKLRVDGRHAAWRYSAQQLARWKEQGIPGRATAQAHHTRLSTAELMTLVSLRRTGTFLPQGMFQTLLSLGLRQQHFYDPANEVGIGVNDELTRALNVYLSPRLRLPLWSSAFLTTAVDGRYEGVDVDNRVPQRSTSAAPSGDATRQRISYGGALQVEQFLWDEMLLVVPGVRVDGVTSRFLVAPGEGNQHDQGDNLTQVGISPRIGSRLRLTSWLELRGSGGRYFRPPTLIELFGDQGFVVGNEGLSPERGTSVDGGLVLDLRWPKVLQLYAQVAGFASWADDLIQWVKTGPAARPENIAAARTAGVELGLSARLAADRLRLQGNYTFLDSRNQSPEPTQNGQPLPGRPQHSAFARVSAGQVMSLWGMSVDPRLFFTSEHLSGNTLDPSGRVQVPGRTIHGVGFEVSGATFRLAAEVRNLFDLRTTTWNPPVANVSAVPVPLSDFIGYPLPGRSFWLTLTLTHHFQPQGDMS